MSLLRDRKLKMYFERPTCCYCGISVRIKGQPRTERATIDHLEPRCRGGTNAWRNLRLACKLCNECKGDRTPQQWALDALKPVTSGWKRLLVALVLKLV